MTAVVFVACNTPGTPDARPCPSTIEQARTESLVDVQEAAIRWRLRDWDTKMWLSVYIDSKRTAPSDELMDRLRARYPEPQFVPMSKTESDEHGVGRHRATGEPARSVGATLIEWDSPTRVKVSAGFGGCGDLCGDETELTLHCTDGAWEVEAVGGTLMY